MHEIYWQLQIKFLNNKSRRSMRPTHLTPSLEEVCYLGHGDKVSYVGFAGGRCAPVHLQLSLLKNLLQLLLSKDLLRAHIKEINETKLLGGGLQSLGVYVLFVCPTWRFLVMRWNFSSGLSWSAMAQGLLTWRWEFKHRYEWMTAASFHFCLSGAYMSSTSLKSISLSL